jgi:hypothetical protein
MIWGPYAESFEACYNHNTFNDKKGNCGYDHFSQKYLKCREADQKCGRLQCKATEKSEYRDPVFRLSDDPITSKTHYGYQGICHTIIYPGLQPVDPGLSPDGSMCGKGKMCRHQKCVPVRSVKKDKKVIECPDCNGNGVCNSKGQCHCNDGWAPPFCNKPGYGGSSDIGGKSGEVPNEDEDNEDEEGSLYPNNDDFDVPTGEIFHLNFFFYKINFVLVPGQTPDFKIFITLIAIFAIVSVVVAATTVYCMQKAQISWFKQTSK